ncbi:MAG: peptidyl-prolyl cis-trans isomerase [Planctomycetota bacterium]|jgi:parvulin-like peptidyl-prolyl isomerase
MEEKLDFSLPEKKRKGALATGLSIVLLLVLAALTAANLYVSLSDKGEAPKAANTPVSAEQTRQLAAKLAQRNLHERAAKVWQDYLAAGRVTGPERAKALFQIGTLLEKANRCAEAVEFYYRSEIAAELSELQPQINAHIKDCFEKLGKFSALRYELIDRTSFTKDEPAGGKIVAEIGAEKMTQADLDAIIESEIDNRLSVWSAFMTPEQLNEQKKQMLQQHQEPQAKQRYLQTWLTQEILYRQALEEKLPEEASVKQVLAEQARAVLSQHIMNRELADKIHVTETDLQTYYSANKDKYLEPAKANISHIVVEDQNQAVELIKRIKEGEDFAALAKQLSQDETTKEKGGKIDSDVTPGAHVPGIGSAPELSQKIFAAQAAALLDEPFKTEKGWEIVRVDQKQAERQKGFDEVREQVMSTLLTQKRQDVQQDYVKQMMEKYNVIVHTSAFLPAGETESEKEDANAAK